MLHVEKRCSTLNILAKLYLLNDDCNLEGFNSMNVFVGLCHSLNGKVGTFQESLVHEMRAYVDFTCTSSEAT